MVERPVIWRLRGRVVVEVPVGWARRGRVDEEEEEPEEVGTSLERCGGLVERGESEVQLGSALATACAAARWQQRTNEGRTRRGKAFKDEKAARLTFLFSFSLISSCILASKSSRKRTPLTRKGRWLAASHWGIS